MSAEKAIQKNIKQLMIAYRMKPKDLAESMRMPRNKVYRWISGSTTPCLQEAAELADLFGVSIDYLCGRVKT